MITAFQCLRDCHMQEEQDLCYAVLEERTGTSVSLQGQFLVPMRHRPFELSCAGRHCISRKGGRLCWLVSCNRKSRGWPSWADSAARGPGFFPSFYFIILSTQAFKLMLVPSWPQDGCYTSNITAIFQAGRRRRGEETKGSKCFLLASLCL